jgi:hypothetical protein
MKHRVPTVKMDGPAWSNPWRWWNQSVMDGCEVQTGQNFIGSRCQIVIRENIVFWELTNSIQIFKGSAKWLCLSKPILLQEHCVSVLCFFLNFKIGGSAHASIFLQQAFQISKGMDTHHGSSSLNITFISQLYQLYKLQ